MSNKPRRSVEDIANVLLSELKRMETMSDKIEKLVSNVKDMQVDINRDQIAEIRILMRNWGEDATRFHDEQTKLAEKQRSKINSRYRIWNWVISVFLILAIGIVLWQSIIISSQTCTDVVSEENVDDK